MVELFAVTIILWILTAIGVLQLNNIWTEQYHSERCISTIYKQISNFYHKALTSQNIDEKPISEYKITLAEEQFTLSYTDSTNTLTEKTASYQEIEGCKSSKHKVLGKMDINGTLDQAMIIQLQPGLKSLNNQRGILISSSSSTNNNNNNILYTWSFEFAFAHPTEADYTNYKKITRFLIDSRTWILKKSSCKHYKDDNKNCSERTSTLD